MSYFITWELVKILVLFSETSRPLLRPTQLLDHCVARPCSPWVKGQGHEADHALASSAEAKNKWIYNSILPYAFR